MSLEDNKRIYERFVEEVINQGNVDVVADLYVPDYVDLNAPPGAPSGLEGVRAVPLLFRGAFPDVHFAIDELVAEGDFVASRVTGSGTNDGSFMGAPPTGKRATWGSKGFFRVQDGKIAEHWGQPDILALLSQIGALPPGQLPAQEETDHMAPAGAPPANPHDPALLQRNKDVVRRLYEEGYGGGRLPDVVSPDYLDHPPARFFAAPRVGPASLQREIEIFRGGFPDLTVSVEALIAEGTSVVARWSWRGANSGALGGIPPTGREATVGAIDFFRLLDGKIVERVGAFDAVGLMQQLGLVPSPGEAPPGARS